MEERDEVLFEMNIIQAVKEMGIAKVLKIIANNFEKDKNKNYKEDEKVTIDKEGK